MNVPVDTIRSWLTACSLNALSPGAKEYVPFDERGVRGLDGGCIDQVLRTIQYAETGELTCQLFTGFPGSGKTTELHRFQRRLEQKEGQWAFVVFVDAANYIDLYAPISVTDVLRMLAWHLDRAATEAEGREWSATGGYPERLWRWLQSDVELKNIGYAKYGLSLMAEIKDNPSFREKADAQLRLRFQEFAREARDVVREAVARIRRRVGLERVVVIVDGLEKLTAVRAEDRETNEQAAESVFGTHAEWLRLDCHVVYTFPLWLRYRMSGLGSRYDGEVLTLPMVKVTAKPKDRTGPSTPHEPGLDALAEMIRLRVNPVEQAFGSEWKTALRPIFEASGGYPRDVLRLVRDAIKRAPSFPVSRAIVQRAIDVLAEEYHQALLSADLQVLAHIARARALPPGITQVRSAAWLFDHYLVLTYRNGEEWHDVHPLVRLSPLFIEAVAAAKA